jgi:hypothetical protein
LVVSYARVMDRQVWHQPAHVDNIASFWLDFFHRLTTEKVHVA